MRALLIALYMTLSISLAAATLGGGLAAYQRGDYNTARTIVEPLAGSGDAHAQYLLGRMHARGEGVLQDYIIAHQWLNLSAARGNRDARNERDRIAGQMTPSQIAEAQQRARAWRPSQSAAATSTSSSAKTATHRTPSPTRGPNTGNLVKDIQSMLSELGYDPGPADGVMGRRTRSAIRTYQLHSDLAVNGQPGNSLRKALATDLGYAPPDSGSTSVASAGNSATSAHTHSASSSRATSKNDSNHSSAATSQSSQAPVYVQQAQRSAPRARTATPSGGNASTAIKDLNTIVEDGVQRRRADRSVLEALQDLVARYDQPLQRVVVEDSFADGNFTRNPTWQVVSGRFWIGRGEGLRSRVQTPSSSPKSKGKEDLGLAVLGALLGQAKGQQQNEPATIALPATIGPVFTLEAELLSGQQPGEFSLGTYRGNNADVSVRLTYRPGSTQSLVLTRHRNGRVLTLATYARALNLEDGKSHHLVWTRNRKGSMRVSIDNRELLSTNPTRRGSPKNGFDGIFATNKGGDFGLRFVRIKSS
jgi:peptidoglycan hydrolase-like protein with peptidoglycan-binding domain